MANLWFININYGSSNCSSYTRKTTKTRALNSAWFYTVLQSDFICGFQRRAKRITSVNDIQEEKTLNFNYLMRKFSAISCIAPKTLPNQKFTKSLKQKDSICQIYEEFTPNTAVNGFIMLNRSRSV